MTKYLIEYTDGYSAFRNKSISDFILYNCGIEYCEPSYSYGPKRRDYHFIHFVKEGKGTLEINGQKLKVHSNQFFVVPAGYISTYTADESHPWKYAWIGFLGIQSNQIIQQLTQKGQYVFSCANAKHYEQKIQKIATMSSDNQQANFFKINGIMYDIIGDLLSETPTQASPHPISLSALAMHYMDLHYYDNIQMSDVATFVGIHPNYLASIFKEDTGQTPKQYLTQLKLAKAQELLIQTKDPINIIANSVGFSDGLSFSKFFSKHLGVSPSQFRKEGNHERNHH